MTFKMTERIDGSYEDFAGLSSENRLLLYCSRASVSRENAAELDSLLPGPLNWEFISEAARSGDILQLLYHNLKGLSNRSLIPPRLIEDSKKAYHETIARNMCLYAELQTILDAFRSAGLQAITLKGAALAGVVYPDIGLRPMLDIDLLVKEDELAPADRVMAGLDYSEVHGLKSRQWFMENHFHLPPYRHVRKPVIVEIHWHIAADSRGMDILKWWGRAAARDIMGHPTLVPSPEDMLIHLSVHLFNHGYDNRLVLKCLCDIFETLGHYEDEIDWKLLQGEIKEQGVEKQVHSTLHLARKVYAPLDDSFVPITLDHADRRFLRVLENSLFANNGNAPINPHLLKSMMFDNFPGKIRYLLPAIFPSRQQMSERYPASHFPAMMFLHYLARPFNLLARYGMSAARMYRVGRGGK